MTNTRSSFYIELLSDKDKYYEYIKPPENIQIYKKEEVEFCPLCNAKNYLMVGKFAIDSIIDLWVKRVIFNPISDIYRHDILEKRCCLNCGLYFYNYHLPDSSFLYEKVIQKINYYPNFRPGYGIASSLIEELKPKSLLEIGSGNGSFLERVKDSVSYVLGSEYNKKALDICINKGLNVSGLDISSFDRKFDFICSFEVLEHIRDTDSFFKNVIPLLNDGGKLIFSVPNPEEMLSINGIGIFNLPPHHQFDFSKKAFSYIAEKYNLKIYYYKEFELSYRHYKSYVKNLTGQELEYPDISGYINTKKEYKGHSHIVVFEKDC